MNLEATIYDSKGYGKEGPDGICRRKGYNYYRIAFYKNDNTRIRQTKRGDSCNKRLLQLKADLEE